MPTWSSPAGRSGSRRRPVADPLAELLGRIGPPDETARAACYRALDAKTKPRRSLVNHVLQPGGGVGFAVNIEIRIANHVGEHEGFHLLQSSIGLPLLDKVGDSIEAVGHEVDFGIGLHRLFRIIPDQPDAVAITRLAPQLVGDFEQQGAR